MHFIRLSEHDVFSGLIKNAVYVDTLNFNSNYVDNAICIINCSICKYVLLKSFSDLLAGKFREGYSSTTALTCLGAPFLYVLALSRATPSRRAVEIGVCEVHTYAAKHPHHFEFIDGTRFRAVVSRFFLAKGESAIFWSRVRESENERKRTKESLVVAVDRDG